jgi:solute carrier family 35 protein E3
VNLRLGQYTVKDLHHSDVFPITLSFCSFVVCNNLSLQYNSVGFYQLMKVLTTPVVVVLQNVVYGIDLPWHLKAALAPVCVGVAMATVNDFSFNLVSRLSIPTLASKS